MRLLAIAGGLLSIYVSAAAAASSASEFFIYRRAGNVPLDINNVPVMTLIASTTAPSANTDAGLVYLSKVHYNNSMAEIGWDQVDVAPDRSLFLSNLTALQGWYAAGYAEGYATMESISGVIRAQGYNYSINGQKWVNDNIKFMRANAVDPKNIGNPFWTQVQKQLVQMEGMTAGYNARATASNISSRITFDLVFQINILNEYSDIAPAAEFVYGNGLKNDEAHIINIGQFRAPRTINRKKDPPVVPQTEGHCSALIKFTKTDIFMAHDTWSGFNIFVGRQYKTYHMETTVSMSSNAMLINSGDDWYQSSNKLAVIETTNDFTNTELYKLIKPQCVPEFMRVMIANYLATTAQQWTEVFSIHQSGTYCNQWMILDLKLYTKGMLVSQLPDGLFWIAEEIPGKVASADLTGFLRLYSYWGSYNIPYFSDIYQASGFADNQKAYGSFFSWFMCPRAQIFRRDHDNVVDLPSMQKMMRYNNWEKDELSTIPNCDGCNPARSPMLGISSRGDLVPKNASYGNMPQSYSQDFGFNWFGATDSKISSYDMLNNGFAASIINGPTHDTQPVFSWNVDPTNPLAVLPGMVQTFDFNWETLRPKYMVAAPVPQVVYRNITVDVYRRDGDVSFDANGVPQMKLVVGLRNTFGITADLIPMASAVYNESGLVTGFDQMTVSPVQSLFVSDESALQAWYAAGVAEGFASAEAIADMKKWRSPWHAPTEASIAWIETHIAYMRTNSLSKFTPFWKQVRKQLLQMEGMVAGMNLWRVTNNGTFAPLTFFDIFMINFRYESDDVISIVTAPVEMREGLLLDRKRLSRGDHCSALVKVVPDDLFMSHTTWTGYDIMMHKQIKTYIFETTVTFSSSAGFISSGDDWYQTSNKLGVQETTNEFKNVSLYSLIKPQCVSEFMRVMVANYLAPTAQQWVTLYSMEPSGTYCNQWMVVDYKKYTPNVNQSSLQDGLLYVVEEIPGLIQSEDMSWFLRKNGYWASYNVPYFPNIALVSGFTEAYEQFGDFYSWEHTPRANIFRRDHTKVVDVESMRSLMRFNDWEHDPLSIIPNCTGCVPANNPICTIAARADLIPLDATFGDLNKNFSLEFVWGPWGAPDSKISSFKMINNGFHSSCILSPPNEMQPTFNWNSLPDFYAGFAPGMVQYYNFSFVDAVPSLPIPNPTEILNQRFYVYNTFGDGVPAPITSIPNITFAVSSEFRGNDKLIASVQYNRTSATIGWDQITVTGNPALLSGGHPLQAWYGAGIAEGYATMQSIKDVVAVQNYSLDAAAQLFVETQLNWMRVSSSDRGLLRQGYWRQVRKQLLQMEGIAVGFNRRAEELGETTRITMMDVFRINLADESSDIIAATNHAARGKKDYSLGLHCSAIVRLTDDDVFVGHDMWFGYNLLVGRQYKTYEMETTVSMSSNALYIASGDDWYITSNKLAAMETTNDFFNTSLYDLIVPQTTPEFMRVMIANYLATTAQQWTELFAQNHSGTYCNQYMVFDYKLHTRGSRSLPSGAFWVVEELPGMVRSGDQTELLVTQGYWISYNIPFYKDIFITSGYSAKRDKYGSFFDHDDTPRAKIFKRAMDTLVDLESVKKVLRYNDWQNDALSTIPNCPKCSPQASPMLSIAARGDLVPTNNYRDPTVMDTFYGNYYVFNAFGAIDAKITSHELIENGFHGVVQLGPTHDTQPVFSWAKFPQIALGQASGMIQTFDFEYVMLAPLTAAVSPPSSEPSHDKAWKLVVGVIVTSLVAAIMIGSVLYCVLSKVERKSDIKYEKLPNGDVQ